MKHEVTTGTLLENVAMFETELEAREFIEMIEGTGGSCSGPEWHEVLEHYLVAFEPGELPH